MDRLGAEQNMRTDSLGVGGFFVTKEQNKVMELKKQKQKKKTDPEREILPKLKY